MESYLFKKGRGESKLFGRKNWKKRWCILEGQYLTYFEDFDLEKKIPINKKVTRVISSVLSSLMMSLDRHRVSPLSAGVKYQPFLIKKGNFVLL
jgi:hypothetical protein